MPRGDERSRDSARALTFSGRRRPLATKFTTGTRGDVKGEPRETADRCTILSGLAAPSKAIHWPGCVAILSQGVGRPEWLQGRH
jgi:hypothetical protein